MPPVPGLLAACGGFLVGVLWMDLMFDVQTLAHPAGGPLPDAVLASIAAYYRRVTTDAHPMGLLVGAVMLVTLAGTMHQLLRGRTRLAARVGALLLAGVPIVAALGRVLPNAVALGARTGSLDVQSALARAICRDHLLCLAAMLAFVALQLRAARGAPAAR
jgi:hypothetical protein